MTTQREALEKSLAEMRELRSVVRYFWHDDSPLIGDLDDACGATDDAIARAEEALRRTEPSARRMTEEEVEAIVQQQYSPDISPADWARDVARATESALDALLGVKLP